MVADLAMRLGYSEPVQAVRWLHDTVEDTDTRSDEIRDRFGNGIAVMVDSVTYTKEDRLIGIYKIAKVRTNPGSHG